ncbi:MAG: AMP-binding protein [Prevotellaceae bacterium]|nr:AMP-binding protein [Prevotellaceae bacterium]
MNTESFLANVENSLKTHGNLPALTDFKEKTVTYEDVAYRIAKLHVMFEIYGLKKGDKIALTGKNSVNWAVSFLSVVTCGAVAVPILHEFTAENIHNIVNHSDATILLVDKHLLEQLDISQMPELGLVLLVDDFSIVKSKKTDVSKQKIDSVMKEKYPENFSVENINFHKDTPEELMMISYTSGTTGYSKGVMLPYRSLLSNMRFGEEVLPNLKTGDSVVSMLPMAHMYGLAFEFLYEFIKGCHIHFLSRLPTPQIILDAFSTVKPRLVVTVPLIVEKIFKKRLAPAINRPVMKIALRLPLLNQFILKKINKKLVALFGDRFIEVIIGGASFNADAEKFFKRIKFRYTVGYGMTECGPIIAYEDWSKTPLYSCGKAAPRMEIKINSPDPENIPGEIMTRGDNVMLGYYKNQEATNLVLTQDGWLNTGDLGIINSDGYLFIKGRSKNMILGANGQNIYPEEIESKLNNTDLISESLIIEINGKIVALAYPDSDAVASGNFSQTEITAKMEEIRVEINRHLPAYSQISQIKIQMEEFEKTPKKSIKRYLYG